MVEDPIPHEGYYQVAGNHPSLRVLGGDRPIVIPVKERHINVMDDND